MSHCTIQYEKPPAENRDARISRDASNSNNAINSRKSITAGPPATASWKETSETIASSGMPAIAERPATVTHQELKGRQQHKYWYVM
jgi:hypothetical protein